MRAKRSVPRANARGEVELLDVAARHGVLAGWVTLFVAAFVSLMVVNRTPAATVELWFGSMAFSGIAGIGVSSVWRQQARRRSTLPEAARLKLARRYSIAYDVTAGLQGLLWGALAVVIGQADDAVIAAVAFVLGGALVLSISVHAGNRFAQWLFAVPIVVLQEFVLLRHGLHGGALPRLLPIGWLVLAFCVLFAQRRAADALRARLAARISYERHANEQAALLDNTPLGIVVVRDREIVVCNDALLKMFGYPQKEDLLGRSIRILLPDEESWHALQEHAAEAMKGEAVSRIVKRRRFDGSLIDVMLKVAVVASNEGVLEFIGIYEDVNDRIAIEANYRHLMRMQTLVFEAAGEGIAIVNDGIIEQANQALSLLLGLSTAQLAGKPLCQLFEDPEGWTEIERHFQRLGSTLKLERRVKRSDGRGLWVNVTGCLVDAPSTEGEHGMRAIWILADLSVQKRREAESWHHANHDVMTGLPNRRFLQDRLDQALAFARRDGRKVGIVILDLDGFKAVNDTHGHRCGDAVLEEVARRLSMTVRELDTVGRWGGDEFVLVLKEIDSYAIVEETVRRVIARLSEPILFREHRLSIGASVGIALYPDHGEEVETLMLAADLAMYESKGASGNTWRFASAAVRPPRGKYRPADTSISSPTDD